MARARTVKGSTFVGWLIANGAEVRGACQYETARFRAHGILCIVYDRNRKGRVACVPQLAREALEAWEAGRPLDLTNPAEDDGPELETFRARGRRLLALHERQAAGEPLDLTAEAESFGITPDRLAITLTSWARLMRRQEIHTS